MSILAARVLGASLLVHCASEPSTPPGPHVSPEPSAQAAGASGGAWRDRVTATRAFETALTRVDSDPRAALVDLDRAIAADPEHALARVHAAEIRLQLSEELPRAQADLAQALTLLPTSPRAHLRAGQVAHALSEDARAAAFLGRAVELKPDWAEPQIALIDVLLSLDRTTDAVVAAKRAHELEPARMDIATRLANTLAKAGRLTDAARVMEAVAQDARRSAPLYRRAAALWEEAGSAKDAARLRATADRLDPPPKTRKLRELPKARRR